MRARLIRHVLAYVAAAGVLGAAVVPQASAQAGLPSRTAGAEWVAAGEPAPDPVTVTLTATDTATVTATETATRTATETATATETVTRSPEPEPSGSDSPSSSAVSSPAASDSSSSSRAPSSTESDGPSPNTDSPGSPSGSCSLPAPGAWDSLPPSSLPSGCGHDGGLLILAGEAGRLRVAVVFGLGLLALIGSALLMVSWRGSHS